MVRVVVVVCGTLEILTRWRSKRKERKRCMMYDTVIRVSGNEKEFEEV